MSSQLNDTIMTSTPLHTNPDVHPKAIAIKLYFHCGIQLQHERPLNMRVEAKITRLKEGT